MNQNPDIRGADEVGPPGPMGWVIPGTTDEQEMIVAEQRGAERLAQDMPFAFAAFGDRAEWHQPTLDRWMQFQKDQGRCEGSMDFSLLDEFLFGEEFKFPPQIIGSCVWSNTLERIVERVLFHTALVSGEWFGKEQSGRNNVAPWIFNYGAARQRANMRGGDGLYCAPMRESIVKDGVLLCDAPSVAEFYRTYGIDGSQHYPEPQSSRTYRVLGDWPSSWMSKFRADVKYRITESVPIRSIDELDAAFDRGDTAFVCSSEAIHKVGEHPDGFAIHARNPRDSWAHNMGLAGRHVASDGEIFYVEANKSWGWHNVYRRRRSELGQRIASGQLTIGTVGPPTGPVSMLPQPSV